MPDDLVHIARGDVPKHGGYWTTFCGHLRKGHNVAPKMWVILYRYQYITCRECVTNFEAKIHEPA